MPDETGSDLYLTDISPTDKPWDVHRALASRIERLYTIADFQRYAERMRDCSLLLGFCLKADEDGTLTLRLDTARFCRVRHCCICQWRKMLMWRARFFKALPKVIEAYPTARWIFLTLTVQNCPLEELRATLKVMNKAWERLSQRKQFPALGWVRSVEVTRAAGDWAHPHFHAILMVPSSYFTHGYIKQAEWSELWKQALRADYTPIVNIKTVKEKRRSTAAAVERPLNGEGVPAALLAGILETLKYAVKPADLAGLEGDSDEAAAKNAQWLAELTQQLHKTRSISVGGVLKEFISEEEPEDLIHAEDEEIELSESDLQLWFGWREMVKRYAKVEK